MRVRVGVRVRVRVGRFRARARARARVRVRVRVRVGVVVRVWPRTGELAVQQVRGRSAAQLLDAGLVLESPHGPGEE